MRHFFPVLAILAGLGSSISFAQNNLQDPFTRYLASVKAGKPETALVRFAGECGVDVAKDNSKFAVGSGSTLTLVKDLSKGLRTLDTDFYSTAETWVEKDRVLVELWANSDDVGSEVRYLKCFANKRLLQAEVISWNVPEVQSRKLKAWGYSRRWERTASERIQQTKVEFVDGSEMPILKPKLDADDRKSLLWIPPLGPLSELKLPASMLR
jgi:hypothetical protein